MPDPIGASPDSALWAPRPPVSTAGPAPPWTAGTRLVGAVGPIYFLYGGASVWVLVR
jgi:hypothetical protein